MHNEMVAPLCSGVCCSISPVATTMARCRFLIRVHLDDFLFVAEMEHALQPSVPLGLAFQYSV